MTKITPLTLQDYLNLANQLNKLTDSELGLHHYIQSHFSELIYCGIIDLAINANVSKATIGRYLNKLGFTGYSSFKKSIEKGVSINQLRSPIIIHNQKEINYPFSTINLTNQFSNNIQNLFTQFLDNLDISSIDNMIELLLDNSKRIFIVGPSSSFAMAKHFSTLMKYFRDNMVCLSLDVGELPKDMLRINKDDILIIFSYYRFNNIALDIAKWFYYKQSKIILITNSAANPYAKFTDIQFVLPSEANAIFQSRVIGFYFIELILHLCYEKSAEEGNFQELESLFEHFHTFSN